MCVSFVLTAGLLPGWVGAGCRRETINQVTNYFPEHLGTCVMWQVGRIRPCTLLLRWPLLTCLR